MEPATLSRQTSEKRHGKLTIFTSYVSGTGKSYTMLEEAEKARQAGLDVVIGLVSCDSGRKPENWQKSLRFCPVKL